MIDLRNAILLILMLTSCQKSKEEFSYKEIYTAKKEGEILINNTVELNYTTHGLWISKISQYNLNPGITISKFHNGINYLSIISKINNNPLGKLNNKFYIEGKMICSKYYKYNDNEECTIEVYNIKFIS